MNKTRTKWNLRGTAAIAFALLPGLAAAAQAAQPDMPARYQKAESFLAGNLATHMNIAHVRPHWIGHGDRFWYMQQGPDGKQFILVDPAANTQVAAFDQARLAKALATAARKPYRANALPFDEFKFVDGAKAIRLWLGDVRWRCTLDDYRCKKDPDSSGGPYISMSPNGRWAAYVHDHNLYLRDVKTGAVQQLTHDGKPRDDYATPPSDLGVLIEQHVTNSDDVKPQPAVFWSPDSSRLVTYRIDSRKAGRFDSIQFVPPHQLRPIAYNYVYQLPGETLPLATPIIFEITPRVRRIDVETPPIPEVKYWDGPDFTWYPDSRHFHYTFMGRGDKFIELREVDAATGAQTVLHREDAKPYPYVDPGETQFRFLDHHKQFLWTSERSGWNQLYLYDAGTDKPVRQLTHGDWVVREIVAVDEKAREVYFRAAGVTPGMDPYDTQLFRVSLDGGPMQLLTPEDAYHLVSMSPDGKYFVDNYSRPDLPSVSVLRRATDGSRIRVLEQTDTTWLEQQGWVPPIAFKGKATDGKTDLYGLIVRPTHFDPHKKYPVLENIYTGPQGFFVPKTFMTPPFNTNLQAMAELGFVVVMVDGRGTTGRSRDFHDFSYHNLGNVFGDHVAMIKQMAAKYPWMDASRVGIYGASAGGYGSTHAFLQYPDFYKVCVSTSGDHDPRLDKAVWNEVYQGYPVGKDYAEQANEALVDRLKGHLLLIHGDIDDNVNPVETMRLVDALMTADKPFDMLLVPNMYHGDSGPHARYVTLRRWNYFVQHLLGETPPTGFRIQEPADVRH